MLKASWRAFVAGLIDNEPYPILDQNDQNRYPVSDQNRWKTISFGAHTVVRDSLSTLFLRSKSSSTQGYFTPSNYDDWKVHVHRFQSN